MITTKSTLAGLPLGVWAHTERLLHRGCLSVLRGKTKSPNLTLRYRSSGECRLRLTRISQMEVRLDDRNYGKMVIQARRLTKIGLPGGTSIGGAI
ncbi:MAG: hypothetical protein GY798_18570 [Hyphomicrobiales bacterium]|nr:hypothetical protein [Hyphomicrobiales bacterium]